MASSLHLNDKVQRWLKFHNVSLDVIHPDSSGSYLWPQQVSGAADLLETSARNTGTAIRQLAATLEDETDELWVNDPAPSVLSACSVLHKLSMSDLHLSFRETLIWTIMEGLIPDTGVMYQASFAQPRCDTGDEELDQRSIVPLYGRATLLCVREYGSADDWDYYSVSDGGDSDDSFWQGSMDNAYYMPFQLADHGEADSEQASDIEDEVEEYLDQRPPIVNSPQSIVEDLTSGQHLTLSTLHPSPLVPLICVADEVDIVPLLSSALLQRRELGMTDPVVGVLLPEADSRCQVLFGWIEEQTDGRHALPHIHIVYADDSDSAASSGGGLFDLHLQSQLMHFVAYLASLGDRSLLLNLQPSLEPDACSPGIPWRADAHLASRLRGHQMERIWIWLHTISDSRETNIEDVPGNSEQGVVMSRIDETSREDHIPPSIADWLRDHRTFVTGYMQRGDIELYSTTDDYDKIYPHEKYAIGLAQLVSVPSASEMSHMMKELAYSLLVYVLRLPLEERLVDDAQMAELRSLIKQLLAHEAFVARNTGLTTLSARLGNPLVVLTANRCHKNIIALVGKEGENEVAWRHTWDAMHWIVWSQSQIGRDQSDSKQDQKYYILPEAEIVYLRCKEFDRATTFSTILSTTTTPSSDQASSVPSDVERRLDNSRCDATKVKRTRNFLHAEHEVTFKRIKLSLVKQYCFLTDTPSKRAKRVAKRFREARVLAICAAMDVTDFEMQALVSEDEARTSAGKDHALYTQIENLRTRLESQYPKGGTCTAAFAISIPNFRDEVTSAIGDEEAATNFVKRFACFRGARMDIADKELKKKMSDSRFQDVPDLDLVDSLFLPYFIADCKLNVGAEARREAANQQRMNTASVVSFLHAIGINDFPVYGLAQSGSLHTVSMTWYSSEDDIIYVCDRNTPEFDLRKHVDIMRYLSFLIRLEDHAEDLRRRYEEAKPGFLQRIHRAYDENKLKVLLPTELWWNAENQADFYGWCNSEMRNNEQVGKAQGGTEDTATNYEPRREPEDQVG